MGAKIHTATMLFLVLLLLQQGHGQQVVEVCSKINDNTCDPAQGTWVYDDGYPFYDSSVCSSLFPFIGSSDYGNCQANGNKDYLQYRWQPSGCDLPRFDADDFLSRLVNKSVMFVGEDIGHNHWESLMCMLYSSLEPNRNGNGVGYNNGILTFSFSAYNATFIFYSSPFLVNLERDPVNGRVLQLDSIDRAAATRPQPLIGPWNSQDVLIFNSWYSWHAANSTKLWDSIEEEGNKIVKEMDPLVAYEKGLTTWANWIDANIDPAKTTVFFQGISPNHLTMNNGGSCVNQTKPLTEAKSSETAAAGQEVMERVLGRMSTPVYLLNITSLSRLRPDAHPSSYGTQQGMTMDCTFWCFSGVLDAWNQLLCAFFIQS